MPAPTLSVFRRAVSGALLFGVAACGASADVVTDWNAIMQSKVVSNNPNFPNNPFFHTRNAAITHLAVFEAVNAITGDYEPYLGTITAPPGASPEAAAIAAAYGVLSVLYPDTEDTVDKLADRRDVSLAMLPDGPAKTNGIAVGLAAAEAMLALRSNDGSSTPVAYTPGAKPGDWQPTGAPATLPGWGLVSTFGINNGAQFRAAPPPRLGTGKYARDCNEVKEIGSIDSGIRPAHRADVARVYHFLTVVNLYHPIARQLSEIQGKTLSENARIFALLAMAGADALISSMESKYHYNLWRPVTAIRTADTDGNGKTSSDPMWQPLLSTPPFATPPYPSYPSNHASLAGASLAVLQDAFGNAGHNISLSTANAPGVVLNYTVLSDIATDIDDARLFGGIHFRFDQDAGAKMGRKVGHHILQHKLLPVRGQGNKR